MQREMICSLPYVPYPTFPTRPQSLSSLRHLTTTLWQANEPPGSVVVYGVQGIIYIKVIPRKAASLAKQTKKRGGKMNDRVWALMLRRWCFGFNLQIGS